MREVKPIERTIGNDYRRVAPHVTITDLPLTSFNMPTSMFYYYSGVHQRHKRV
jgi:hypothetical protein